MYLPGLRPWRTNSGSCVVGPIRCRKNPGIVGGRDFNFPLRWVYSDGKYESSGNPAINLEIEIEGGTPVRFDFDSSRPLGPETDLGVRVEVILPYRNRIELKFAVFIGQCFEFLVVFDARKQDGVFYGWDWISYPILCFPIRVCVSLYDAHGVQACESA